MEKAMRTISEVAGMTDRVILFHSAAGKDSIALLEMASPYFREVVCVHMYVVKGLEHIARHIRWATERYSNVRFVQIPHYATYSYRKTGFMGCAMEPDTRLRTLGWLTDAVRERTGIEWAMFGFKQNDSMNRRAMLRSYGDLPMSIDKRKAYPLSEWSNAYVMEYIRRNRLMTPEWYGGERGNPQSSGTDITDPRYLMFLRDRFPEDYVSVLNEYPMAERILFEYEYGNKDK